MTVTLLFLLDDCLHASLAAVKSDSQLTHHLHLLGSPQCAQQPLLHFALNHSNFQMNLPVRLETWCCAGLEMVSDQIILCSVILEA